MRLEQLNEATLTDEQRDLYGAIAGAREGVDNRPRHLVGDDGEIRGPFNHMLHAPRVGDATQRLGGVLRFQGELSDIARELVILLVAQSQRSEFEWWAHEPIARAAGVTDDQIEAVSAGDMPNLDDDATTSVVVATARALVQRGDLDDDEYERAASALGDAALVELTTLVGYYISTAVQLRVFRVDIPAGEPRTFT